MFTRVHEGNGSVDCDGADMEALQHFAEAQPLVKVALMFCESLKDKQKCIFWLLMDDSTNDSVTLDNICIFQNVTLKEILIDLQRFKTTHV